MSKLITRKKKWMRCESCGSKDVVYEYNIECLYYCEACVDGRYEKYDPNLLNELDSETPSYQNLFEISKELSEIIMYLQTDLNFDLIKKGKFIYTLASYIYNNYGLNLDELKNE